MDTTAQWPQGIGLINRPMEASNSRAIGLERRSTSSPSSPSSRPHSKDQILNCPRCNSTNTKFCYYNNYSLSQPRYFCKTCRRYWTQGGSLRNVPVGGGSRKHKRSSSSASSSLTTTPSTTSSQALSKMIMINGGQDLNLAYNHPAQAHHHHHDHHQQNYSTPSHDINMISKSSRELISSFLMPPLPGSDSNTIYPTGLMFPLQEFKPTLNFSLDHHHHHHHHQQQQQHHHHHHGLGAAAAVATSVYGSSSLQEVQGGSTTTSTSARLLFPVTTDILLKEKVQSSGTEERDSSTASGYNWINNNNNNNNNNGMLTGGSW
ncbi:hypothetical protein ACOSQ3_031968 [Xanthoceras sorbifolium]